ncbi:MAG: hypothetical protein L0212_09515 [Acidobacteria bacterium]|nr:hypothetical protein [Acidobacteriota bacterium]
MKTPSNVRAGAAVLALLAGLMAAAVCPAQEQQQQQQQQQPPPSFGAPMNQPSPEEVEAYTKIATARGADERLTLVQEFLAKYPESLLKGRVYASAAEAYRMQNKHAQVIEYGEKAIEDSQGRDAFTMLMVADSLAESALPIHADYKEKLARAEQHATRALELLPELFASMQRRPEVPEEEYARQQRRVEALGHAILGNVYFRRQDHAKAVAELTKAIETDGYKPDAVDLQRLGFAHMRLQQLKEAEAAFTKCVEHGGSAAADCQQRLEQVRARMAGQEKPQP